MKDPNKLPIRKVPESSLRVIVNLQYIDFK